MAKRDTKNAAGLAKAGPSADQSGQAKSDSKEKTSSKRKWLYSLCLFLLAIIIGAGFVLFGHFPELRRSISFKFIDESIENTLLNLSCVSGSLSFSI